MKDPIIESDIERLEGAIVVRSRHYYVVDDFRYPYEEGEYFGYSLYCNSHYPTRFQIKAVGNPSEMIILGYFNEIAGNHLPTEVSPRKEPYILQINFSPLSEIDTESYWVKERVNKKARELVNGSNNLEDKISNLLNFVSSIPILQEERPSWYGIHTPKEPAETVEDNSAYDCKDYSELMLHLCRSIGIPARGVSGLCDRDISVSQKYDYELIGDRFPGHRWMAYHDGKEWREIDPTNDVSINDPNGKNNYKSVFVLRTGNTDTSCEISVVK